MEPARREQIEPHVSRDRSTVREWTGPGCAAEAADLSADTTLPEGE